ncbi:helix-turn-helix domain-containing protein [Clostridium minihomine]|uniref:helix-turn-helix domain-containing protein n=1 Tax=Clostridium minihomine TaxID=2045012 RepID=UPI000C78AFAE|nr:helix-turn-helix transcriptional regulator [Clostridium minihomine]
MLPLYEKLEALCKDNKINITQMCKEAEVSRSVLSDYKAGRSKSISMDNIGKLANHFNVPIDFLMGHSQFTLWEQMNKDRKKFLMQSGISEEKLKYIWGFDLPDTASISLQAFISFISNVVKDLHIDTEGNFIITLKEEWLQKEKPALPQEDEQEMTFDDFTYAFYGEAKELTEENKRKLLEMAKFFKMQQEKEKEGNK